MDLFVVLIYKLTSLPLTHKALDSDKMLGKSQIRCCTNPRNVQISSRKVSRFTVLTRSC